MEDFGETFKLYWAVHGKPEEHAARQLMRARFKLIDGLVKELRRARTRPP